MTETENGKTFELTWDEIPMQRHMIFTGKAKMVLKRLFQT